MMGAGAHGPRMSKLCPIAQLIELQTTHNTHISNMLTYTDARLLTARGGRERRWSGGGVGTGYGERGGEGKEADVEKG
jgi:hypothetical protein